MRSRDRRLTVLGLCSFTHDSAAALITGGKLTGMAEEERQSGVKHTREYPAEVVQWLLADAGLTSADVDVVAYNFAGHRYLAGITGIPGHLMRAATRSRALPRAASFAVINHRYRQRMKTLKGMFLNGQVRGLPHHLAHGTYAFAASGFDQAAVLIIDSLGETCTTSISSARTHSDGDVGYRIIETISDPASLGYAYGAVTEHLGWRRGDEEGTVMALAALGDPARFRSLFAQAIPLTPAGFALDPALFPLRVLRHGWPRVTPAFTAATCPPRLPDEEVSQVHADLAAALQERTEQVMLHLARRARGRDRRRAAVPGRRRRDELRRHRQDPRRRAVFDEVYVPPAPGDSGTAIGAALAAHLDITGVLPAGSVRSLLPRPGLPGLASRPGAPAWPGCTADWPIRPATWRLQLADGEDRRVVPGRAGGRAAGAGQPVDPRLPARCRTWPTG